MLTRSLLLLGGLLALAAAQTGQPAAQPAPLPSQEVALKPFVEVDACLPINVLVEPNTTDNTAYFIRLAAEPEVLQALSFNVTNDALMLENTGPFNTSRPIQITVSLPAGRLQAINHRGTGKWFDLKGAELFVAPGFNVRTFVAATSFAAGRLYVNQMVARDATVLASGTGDVVLTGSFGTVNATSTGTGALYITGANDTVQLDLRGVANAFVQPAMPTTTITGKAQGINVVQYTDGVCRVQSNFPFLSVCQSVPFVNVPAPQAVWTCGIEVRGTFTCSDRGTAYTSSANGFVGASGAEGTTPVTTTTPQGVSAFTPGSFQFAGASPAGTGTQQQAGAVTPQGTTASSQVAGTGSVSATSVAGPQGASTSTTQGGATTAFQTTGHGTTGGTTGAGGTGTGTGGTAGAQGMGGSSSSASSSSSATSTAFATASPSSSSSASATSGGVPAVQTASSQGPGQVSAGVIRTGADGTTQATAISQACQATTLELRMPARGTQ